MGVRDTSLEDLNKVKNKKVGFMKGVTPRNRRKSVTKIISPAMSIGEGANSNFVIAPKMKSMRTLNIEKKADAQHQQRR